MSRSMARDRPPQCSVPFLLGLVFIAIVAVIWVAASYIVKDVLEIFPAPFFLTYVCNSLFVLYLPLSAVSKFVGHRWSAWRAGHRSPEYSHLPRGGAIDHKDGGVPGVGESHDRCDDDGDWPVDEVVASMTLGATARISLMVCPFWFAANFLFNVSLGMTSVVSNTLLSSTSSIWTLLLCAFLGLESVTVCRGIGIVVAIGGTMLYTTLDAVPDSAPNNATVANATQGLSSDLGFLGDGLTVAAAFLYGMYTTLMKQRIPTDGKMSMTQFFGFLGLFNALIFGPVVLVLWLTSVEPLGQLAPPTMGLILLKASLDNFLSDYLWAQAVVMTSATIATVGMSLQWPLTLVIDHLRTHALPNGWAVLGSLLVVLGFFMVLTRAAPGGHIFFRPLPIRCCPGRCSPIAAGGVPQSTGA